MAQKKKKKDKREREKKGGGGVRERGKNGQRLKRRCALHATLEGEKKRRGRDIFMI